MPSYKFTDQDNQTFELLPPGDYPYEIVGVSSAIQSGGKTAGSEYIDVKVMIYKDTTFQRKLSQLHDRMIFHPSCLWKIDCFVKSSNLLLEGKPPVKGQEIKFTSDLVIGLRGWCSIKIQNYTNAAGEDKKANRINTWWTNKEKIARAPIIADEDVPVQDDIPF